MISHFSRMQSVTSSLSQGSKAYIMHEAPWRSELWIHNCTLGLKWKVPHLEATRSFPKYLFAILILIINIRIKTFFFLIFWFQQGGQDLITTGEKRKIPLELLHSKPAVMFQGQQGQSRALWEAQQRACTLTWSYSLLSLNSNDVLVPATDESKWKRSRPWVPSTWLQYLGDCCPLLLFSLFICFFHSKPTT